jgi:hypothetical protein
MNWLKTCRNLRKLVELTFKCEKRQVTKGTQKFCRSYQCNITAQLYCFLFFYLIRYLWDPMGNVHFSGENLSFAPGWIQGALESGLRSAYQVYARHMSRVPVKGEKWTVFNWFDLETNIVVLIPIFDIWTYYCIRTELFREINDHCLHLSC